MSTSNFAWSAPRINPGLRWISIPAGQVALEYRHGKLQRVLAAGRHPRGLFDSWSGGFGYESVDVRERLTNLSPQDVLCADQVQVKVTATIRWRVADPVRWFERSASPELTVYVATQLALREALAGLTAEAVAQRGAPLPIADMTAAVGAVGESVGIEVIELIVRDVMLPAEVRQAAQSVVTAKAKGLAQLEAARAETAALRSLANGAKLLDEHPALAQLRLVQSLPNGAHLVLKVGTDESRAVATGME